MREERKENAEAGRLGVGAVAGFLGQTLTGVSPFSDRNLMSVIDVTA